jgi:hypothetical protein
VKVAVTDCAPLIVTAQLPVPEHPAPAHPLKVEPDAADAVSVTVEPSEKVAEQVEPQSIPAGDETTEPEPAPASDKDSCAFAGPNASPHGIPLVPDRSMKLRLEPLPSMFDRPMASAFEPDQ